jgi:hypothetical protein
VTGGKRPRRKRHLVTLVRYFVQRPRSVENGGLGAICLALPIF